VPATLQETAPSKKIAITLGEEMEEILTEWYGALGKSVPPEELQICREADATEHKEYLLRVAMEKPAQIYEYGTPEFWKDFQKRKGEKVAARLAAGLSPVEPAKAKKITPTVKKKGTSAK